MKKRRDKGQKEGRKEEGEMYSRETWGEKDSSQERKTDDWEPIVYNVLQNPCEDHNNKH